MNYSPDKELEIGPLHYDMRLFEFFSTRMVLSLKEFLFLCLLSKIVLRSWNVIMLVFFWSLKIVIWFNFKYLGSLKKETTQDLFLGSASKSLACCLNAEVFDHSPLLDGWESILAIFTGLFPHIDLELSAVSSLDKRNNKNPCTCFDYN